MKISDFFEFGSKMVPSNFHAVLEGLKKDDNGIHDVYRLQKGNYTNFTFPIILKQYSGKKLTDILDTGWSSFYLISNKLKIILEENKITGWKTFSVKLYDKKGNEVLGYHGFSITGRCGRIDYKKAEVVDRQSIPDGPTYKVYKGLYIGLDEWDGMDFFIPDKSGFLIVTKKVAFILTANKITNIDLGNLADFEIRVSSVLNKD